MAGRGSQRSGLRSLESTPGAIYHPGSSGRPAPGHLAADRATCRAPPRRLLPQSATPRSRAGAPWIPALRRTPARAWAPDARHRPRVERRRRRAPANRHRSRRDPRHVNASRGFASVHRGVPRPRRTSSVRGISRTDAFGYIPPRRSRSDDDTLLARCHLLLTVSRLSVILADDSDEFLDVMRRAVQRTSTLELLATASDGREAARLIALHRPDAAVLDDGCRGCAASR